MKSYNPYKMFVGSFVPNWLLCRPEISQGAKLCFARLSQYAGENGLCYPSQEVLGAELGVKARQIRVYISDLKAHQLIQITKSGTGNANAYEFLVHEWMEELTPNRCNNAVSNRHDTTGLNRCNTTSKENNIRESYKENIKENTKRKDSDVCALKFYATYPIKKKPTPTKEAFYKLVKNMTKSEAEAFTQKLIDALRLQISERALKERNGVWMPHWREPPAWLNQAGWEDEVNLKIEDKENEKCNRKPTAWDHSARFEQELTRQETC